jgi:hypothetical protein
MLHNVKLGTLIVFDFFAFVAVSGHVVIFTGPIFVLSAMYKYGVIIII